MEDVGEVVFIPDAQSTTSKVARGPCSEKILDIGHFKMLRSPSMYGLYSEDLNSPALQMGDSSWDCGGFGHVAGDGEGLYFSIMKEIQNRSKSIIDVGDDDVFNLSQGDHRMSLLEKTISRSLNISETKLHVLEKEYDQSETNVNDLQVSNYPLEVNVCIN